MWLFDFERKTFATLKKLEKTNYHLKAKKLENFVKSPLLGIPLRVNNAVIDASKVPKETALGNIVRFLRCTAFKHESFSSRPLLFILSAAAGHSASSTPTCC